MDFAYKLRLNQAYPSLNTLRSMHFSAYKRLRNGFRDELFLQRLEQRAQGRQPLAKVALVIRRGYATTALDWDNAYGGLKPVLDCLVMPSSKNPDGLGFIVDDSPAYIPKAPLVIQELVIAPAHAFTEIQILDLNNAAHAAAWAAALLDN